MPFFHSCGKHATCLVLPCVTCYHFRHISKLEGKATTKRIDAEHGKTEKSTHGTLIACSLGQHDDYSQSLGGCEGDCPLQGWPEWNWPGKLFEQGGRSWGQFLWGRRIKSLTLGGSWEGSYKALWRTRLWGWLHWVGGKGLNESCKTRGRRSWKQD